MKLGINISWRYKSLLLHYLLFTVLTMLISSAINALLIPSGINNRHLMQQLQLSPRAFSPLFANAENASSINRIIFSTEAEVLARNQGELKTPTENELENAIKKQRKIASRVSASNDNSLDIESDLTAKGEHDTHTSYDFKIDKRRFGAILMENGVVRINNVLSRTTANEMVQYVDQLLIDTRTAVQEDIFPKEALFGNVFGKENRWDLLMPIEASKEVMHCLKELLHEDSPIATSIASILGENAELYELSTIISDPGSSAQPLHPDIKYQDTTHPLLTCFVALQDIDKEMGPTLFMKNSATKEYHDDLHNRHLDREAKGLVATSYNELGTLSVGDCSLYSAMTLHCGSANKSLKRRRLFYFSFINKALFREEGGRSFVSIRPEVKERNLTLRDLQNMIKDWY